MLNKGNIQGIRLSVATVAICLFLVNLFGYIGFRHSISDDIFGGDTVNTVISRMDSYALKHGNLISDPALFYSMLMEGKNGGSKNNPNYLVYNQLSPEGKEVLERLVKDPTNERDKEKFVLEMNRSVLEKEINWPALLLHLKESLKDPDRTQAGKYYYNLQVLAHLFPNNINDSLSPSFYWKYDLYSLVKIFPTALFPYFTINTPTRYSPMTSLYTAIVQLYLQNSPERIIIAIVLMGLIYATLMTLVFLLAMKFIKSIPWALVAVFLFQASISTMLSCSQLFSLPYLLVPLSMVGAFYAYLQYKESGKPVWLALFFYISIIGPWFREFPGAIPFVVFASEVLSFAGRRSAIILLTCIPLMGHSLYPALFPWLIGLNRGGVYYVFSQGNVQGISNAASQNWQYGGLLFVQFPPTLWIVLLVSIGYWFWRQGYISQEKRIELILFNKQVSFSLPGFETASIILRVAPILLLVLLAYYFCYSFFVVNKEIEHSANIVYGPYLFYLTAFITLLSLRFGVLMPIYFMAVFLPFLRISLAELHLSFALVPLAIIFSLWIKDLFTAITTHLEGRNRTLALASFCLLFGIGMLDHFLNIPASLLTQRRIVETNKAMAEWIKTNTPKHSIVICNFFNFTDVFHYSQYHFDPYETVGNCPMGPTKIVERTKDFENLVKRNLGIRDIYLLAADHPFYPYQKDYHSHKYVRTPPGEIEKLAEFSAKSEYYYVDPVKYFVPRYFISFIGYMDWFIDYYYNNEPTMFKRITYADYTLYKLKDISRGFKTYDPPMLVGAHKGHNIVDYNNLFYAVPQSSGPLDLSKEEDRNYEGILVGKSLEEVKQLINETVHYPPQLVGAHKGHNIVDYNNLFYAVPQSIGALDLSKEEDRNHKEILVGKSQEEVKRLINETVHYPPQLAGAHKGHNIVDYNNLFYAVPQSIGALDLSKEEDRNHKGILVGKSLEEVKQLINQTVHYLPQLAGSHKGYNIVDYDNLFYGVPQSMGPLDLSKEGDRNHKGILIGKDLAEVERLIDTTVHYPPQLAGSHKGYNIVDYDSLFYGVPQSIGPLDLSKEEDRNHKEILVGKSLEEVKQLINQTVHYLPQLAGAHKGHNIVDYNNLFYAVPQSIGPLDLSKEEDRNHKGILVGKDLAEVERLIDKTIVCPPILAGSYKGYNIVDYNGFFYGVPKSTGPLDLSKEEDRNRQGILVGRNQDEVKRLIEAHLGKGSSR